MTSGCPTTCRSTIRVWSRRSEEFGWFVRTDGYVQGGAQAAATTDFRDSPSGLFSFPPECYMHKQASFIPTFFPDGSEYGEDFDFFYFPASAERDLRQSGPRRRNAFRHNR